MAFTLHAPERQAPITPPPLPSIASIRRTHAPSRPVRTPSAAMKRMALVIACAAVYFAFSATFEPSRSQARMNAEAAGMTQARAALPAAQTKPETAADLFKRELSEPAPRGDHAP